jgi:hypothetical protein
MSDYTRTTRDCPLSQIPPESRQAIQEYFRENGLGDPEKETLMCCETKSERKSASKWVTWLEGEQDKLVHTWLLLTAKWLIWVRLGDQTGMVLKAADLNMIRVKEYKSILNKDTGLDIYGYIGESKNRVRGYIGMGAEPVAQEFREQVQSAIDELKPASKKRGWFRWFKG